MYLSNTSWWSPNKQGWNPTAANIPKSPVFRTGYSTANPTWCKVVLHRAAVITSETQRKVIRTLGLLPLNRSSQRRRFRQDLNPSSPFPEFALLGHKSLQGYHRWSSTTAFNKQHNTFSAGLRPWRTQPYKLVTFWSQDELSLFP